ncbi:CD109 antigen-like [Paramacrobiotus metropolitanus]|uniref:CD109 antigen-like n=1 Tax=Paramacrobiotus metropolitanus TaxID=2943436 RepID=UPI002445933E|nr:CD109 antigen-like [Paramacrobiotus metropolitanus]
MLDFLRRISDLHLDSESLSASTVIMHTVGFRILLPVAALVCSCSGLDFVIFGPKTVHSGKTLPVSILCHNASSNVKVDVTLLPQLSSWEDSDDDGDNPLNRNSEWKFKFKKSFVIKPNQLSQLELPIGDLSSYVKTRPRNNVILKINGSDYDDFFDRDVRDIKVIDGDEQDAAKKQFAFVQTDQPLYKAKDTIHFRIVTVDQQLVPVYIPLTVQIRDPQNNIIKQYSNASDPNVLGYFAGDVQLSSEPLLGAWKIEARSSNGENIIGSKEFSVDEYVLPRFGVKILSTPTYVTPSDSELNFFVEANYTFGEPVKGKLEVTVIAPPKWSDEVLRIGFESNSQPSPLNKTIQIADFNGRAAINVPLSSVLDKDRKYNSYDRLEIRANFTETLTGQTRNVSTLISITNKAYKLDLLSNPDTFLPGFPYTLRARVADLTGRPLPPSTKQLGIEVSFYDKRASWGKRISSDKNLNESVVVHDSDDNDSDDDVPMGPLRSTSSDDVGFSHRRHRPFPWPRPPRPSPKPIPAEKISIAVPADGFIRTDIPTPKQARRMELKVIYMEEEKSLTVKGKESPSSSFLDIKPLTDNLQTGKSGSFGVNMTTRTNEVIHFLVQSNSNDSFLWSNSTSEAGSYVVISVPLLESMGRIGRLMVYYVRADKEIVGNILVLSPALGMKNDVNITAQPSSGLGYAKPGEDASFKVTTSPLSFVAFLAMDEGLLLMKSGNDISSDEVNTVANKDKFTLSDLYSTQDYFETAYTSGQFILTNDKLTSSTETEPFYYRPFSYNTWAEESIPILGAAPNSFRGMASAAPQSSQISLGMSAPDIFGGASAANAVSSSSQIFRAPHVQEITTPVPPATSESSKEADNVQAPAQTRKDFRQSFLFETAAADANGFTEIHSKVPDSITTWKISAFSLNNSTGLGLTSVPAKLKVFQPFFAVLNLPFSIVRFENLTAEVLVFNYMSQQQDVTVQLEIRNPDNTTAVFKKNVVAKPSEGTTAAFTVIPQQIGDLTLKVTAQSTFAADQLEKTLPVKPEGVKQYFTRPVFLDLRKSSPLNIPVALPANPTGKVDGSDKVEVRVVGDILGAAMNNLDKLIRLPTGCGEQNMATTTPNLVVAKYLKQINKLVEPQKSKLIANMQLGYQRELKYRHSDNSYSAWGPSDPKGSTWLTAYVARVFAEAVEFVPSIEDDVIKTALRFLVDQQNDEGAYIENGKVIDKQHQGGASSGVALTAYCVLSFLQYKESGKASVSRFDESVKTAVTYLESKFTSLNNDSYSLAITAYALARAKSAKSAMALDLLEQKMIKNSTAAYWTTVASLSDQGADADHSYPTNAKDVEATAYALLAYMANDKLSSALPVVTWLISKQNAEGGFVSTQDTVVGLMGLAEFAKVFVNPPTMQLDISYDEAKRSLSVTPDTAVVLQTIELPNKPKAISLNAQGKGVALAYVSWTYHVAKPAEEVAFDLNLTTTASKSDLRMGICSRYLREGKSSMAVIEVNTLSGYQFDEDEIGKLTRIVPSLRKTEFENKDTKVNLYFDQLEQAPTCLKLTMYRIYKVKDLKDQSVVVYDYYNPKERRTASYSLL